MRRLFHRFTVTVLLFYCADAQRNETAIRDRAVPRDDARYSARRAESAPRFRVARGAGILTARRTARAQGSGGNLRMAFRRRAWSVAVRSHRAPSDRERPGRAGPSGTRDALSPRHQHEWRDCGRRSAVLDAALPGRAWRRRVDDGLSHPLRPARHASGEARRDGRMDESRLRGRRRGGGGLRRRTNPPREAFHRRLQPRRELRLSVRGVASAERRRTGDSRRFHSSRPGFGDARGARRRGYRRTPSDLRQAPRADGGGDSRPRRSGAVAAIQERGGKSRARGL